MSLLQLRLWTLPCASPGIGACIGAWLHLCFGGEKSLFSLESAEKRGSRDSATVPLFILSGHELWISAIHPLSSLLSRGWSWGLIGAWSCTSSASHQGCLRAEFLCTLMGRINLSTSLSGPSANLLGQLVVYN